MAKFLVEIDCDNDAFMGLNGVKDDITRNNAIARILHGLWKQLDNEDAFTLGERKIIRDSNGNRVGFMRYTER